jgi:hypothetical protein
MKNGSPRKRVRLDRETREVEAAIQQAVREAILEHKRAGRSIVVVENGKIREIPADKIKVPRAPSKR